MKNIARQLKGREGETRMPDDSGFRGLFNDVPIGLYRTLAGGELVEANPALAAILGYSDAADLLGKNVTELYATPGERRRLLKLLEEQGDSGNFETELRRRDGTIRRVTMSTRAVRGPRGEVSHYHGAVQDVTEVRRLAQTLRASEAQYRLLFESNPQPTWVYDASSFAFLAVNPAAVRDYGYSRDEFLAMNAKDIRDEEECSPWMVSHPDREADPSRAIPQRRGIWRLRRKDGSVVLTDITAIPILFGGRQAFLAVTDNVTDRVGAEAERERHAQRQKDLTGASIAIAPAAGILELLETIRQRAKELLRAEEVDVLLHGLDSPPSEAHEGSDTEELVAQLKTPEGATVGMLRVRGVPNDQSRESNRSVLGQLSTIASIAIQNARLIAELRDSRDRIEAFSRRLVLARETEQRHLAREFHDQIGQMLTGLRFMLDAAKDGAVEAAAAAEMRLIVDQLTDRVQSLSLDLRPPMLDQLGLLPALLGLLRRFASRTEIEVDFAHADLARRFPPDVETAAFRIVQEGLTNVARHARASRATVRVCAQRQGLMIVVADRGVGFDLQQALRHPDAAGLVGIQDRARALQGTFAVETASGAGTRILVELPLPDEGGRR